MERNKLDPGPDHRHYAGGETNIERYYDLPTERENIAHAYPPEVIDILWRLPAADPYRRKLLRKDVAPFAEPGQNDSWMNQLHDWLLRLNNDQERAQGRYPRGGA